MTSFRHSCRSTWFIGGPFQQHCVDESIEQWHTQTPGFCTLNTRCRLISIDYLEVKRTSRSIRGVCRPTLVCFGRYITQLILFSKSRRQRENPAYTYIIRGPHSEARQSTKTVHIEKKTVLLASLFHVVIEPEFESKLPGESTRWFSFPRAVCPSPVVSIA